MLNTLGRVLSFRFDGEDVEAMDWRYLLFGLALTWLAGIGRYWDQADAMLFQRLGLGSVAYVLALVLLVWLIVLPLGPRRWSLVSVAAFLSFTAPPAFLYALPFDQWLSPSATVWANEVTLLVVATWRVGLLVMLLYRYANLGVVRTAAATLAPLCVIVVTLWGTGRLDHVVALMGDLPPPAPEDEPPATAPAAYLVAAILARVALVGLLFAAAVYAKSMLDRLRQLPALS